MADLDYKDISELKKELDVMRGKKDISTKELYEAVQVLSQNMAEMLEVFGAAAEQMKLEEQSYESSSKKHELIVSKLDKIIDQNKTIAEGMVAIVEMVKEKIVSPQREREELPRPRPEPKPFMRPQQEWQPRPEPAQRTQPIMQMPSMAPQMPQMAPPPMPTPDFGMPPMPPPPSSDMEFPDLGLDEDEPKKKGLFGMFKK